MSSSTSQIRNTSKPTTTTITRTKSASSEETLLQKCTSDATINNDRMFGGLEELMTHIGSSYPHFPRTVLPLVIVTSFLFGSSRFLTTVDQVRCLKTEDPSNNNIFFYSKCLQNEHDDSMQVARIADFMPSKVPKWEFTVVMNAIFMFSTTTVSPRHLALVSLGMISACYFVMAHFPAQIQMAIFVSQFFTEIFRMVAMVTCAESVPKYHRLPALVLLQFGATGSRAIATLFVRLPADLPIDISYCFHFFGYGTIVMIFVTYYTFHDSLYSLLARSKTDEMQNRVTELFETSGIDLAPDAVIDQIAFENFENNESPIEILTRTLKTFKLIQEVLVCGVISGVCLAVNAFMEAEVKKHAEVMFFEKALIPLTSFTLSHLLLVALTMVLPTHRILPVIITIPVLFVVTTMVFLIPDYSMRYDNCVQSFVVGEKALPLYLGHGIVMSALTEVISFFVKVHLLEVMPVLIRPAIISVLFFIQYSFDGNVKDFYANDSIPPGFIMVMISILAMLVLLITPRKKNEMNVFFSEYTRNDKKGKLPPAPEIVK